MKSIIIFIGIFGKIYFDRVIHTFRMIAICTLPRTIYNVIMFNMTATFKNALSRTIARIFHTLKKPFHKKTVAGLNIGTAFLAREESNDSKGYPLPRDYHVLENSLYAIKMLPSESALINISSTAL